MHAQEKATRKGEGEKAPKPNTQHARGDVRARTLKKLNN
jgi:hypothetical protein